jgi:hypothetical protein
LARQSEAIIPKHLEPEDAMDLPDDANRSILFSNSQDLNIDARNRIHLANLGI